MTDSHEGVSGAAAAERRSVARDHAFRRIIAGHADTAAAVRQVELYAAEDGFTLAELDAAELEIRRLYVNECGGEYLLDVARRHLALLNVPAPDGPSPDAEDYRSDDGTAL